MGFFKGMNLARAIMVISILGSIALGWFGWQRHQELEDMKRSLEHRVPDLARDIERLARQHSELSREVARDRLKAQDDPQTYIRRIAAADFIDLGDVEITPRTKLGASRGVVDKTWQIKTNPPRAFARSQIANFLYKLESDSRRVRVTEIDINQSEKRLKDHEIPDDRWLFEATVTSRQATGE